MGPRPQPSDLLLLRTSERVYVFVVGAHQDSLQSLHALHEDALARALRTAAYARVDVWETHDGVSFAVVIRHRAGPPFSNAKASPTLKSSAALHSVLSHD